MLIDEIPEDKIVFYDIETDSIYPAYCRLEMVSYQLGLKGEPRLVDLNSSKDRRRLQELLRDPEILKVSYNGINFDDIVLARYDFYVEPKNRHDMFLTLKTVAPGLPSYGLKFVSWYFFGDWHEPQRRLNAWLLHNTKKRKHYFEAPPEILGVYCQHDVRQTKDVFRLVWDTVSEPLHWKVYNEMELAMAQPLHEMILFAGEWLDPKDTENRILELQAERAKLMKEVVAISNKQITNPGSSTQVARYLHDVDDIELKLSKAGNYLAGKHELVQVRSDNPIADRVLQIRELGKVIQHCQNHLKATQYEVVKRSLNPKWPNIKGHIVQADPKSLDYKQSLSQQAMQGSNSYESIPKGYSMSSAKTRRFQSSSQFGINFQNQSKRTKIVQLVPQGWLGCWIDSRQIENIVHIWASQDSVRRAAYEADPDWNEYVWLANKVLGENYVRKELEDIPSPTNPAWSMYKTYKTVKLATNFFMGPAKFAKTTGLTEGKAMRLFEQVHQACPAIRNIGRLLTKQFKETKHIVDPFGHIYSHNQNEKKMVPYFVQGCGTGSVPKAMTVANYETLHSLDSYHRKYEPCIYNRFTGKYSYAVISGTTHDECAFRISLGLPTKEIIRLIRECLYNMEERFSPLFDGIPLRAQLAVSLTNAADQIEINHRLIDFEERLTNEFIKVGKSEFRVQWAIHQHTESKV